MTTLDILKEPRIATLAFGATPAWLWSPNGGRLLFVNAAGALLLGERNAGKLIGDTPDRLRPVAQEIAKVAGGLPTSGTAQLARIRSLSTGLGRALMCLCQRYRLADGSVGILVVSQEPVKILPLAQRVASLIDDESTAAFSRDGNLLHAGSEAAQRLGGTKTLVAHADADTIARALTHGESVSAAVQLRRVGEGDQAVLFATFVERTAAPVEPAEPEVATPEVEEEEASQADTEAELLAEADEALVETTPPEPAAKSAAEKLPSASLADIAAALAQLPFVTQGQAASARAASQDSVDKPTDDEEELSDEELAELEEALFGGPAGDDPENPDAAENDGDDRAVWAREALSAARKGDRFDDDELRDLQDALGSAVRLAPDPEPRDVRASETTEPPVVEPAPPALVQAPEGPADDEPAEIPLVAEAAAVPSDLERSTRLVEIAERLHDRHHALRFVWATKADGAFTIEPGDFLTLAGAPTEDAQGKTWDEVAQLLAIDPNHRLSRAIASRDTFSSVAIDWPIEGAKERLSVVLSGLPARGRDRTFEGYRGFGVCRDASRVSALIAERLAATRVSEPESAPDAEAATPPRAEPPVFDTSSTRPALQVVPASRNVVPFRSQPSLPNIESAPERPAAERKVETRKPGEERRGLSTGERNAFDEIARQLGARFEGSEPAPLAEDIREAAEAPKVVAKDAVAENPDAILATASAVAAAESPQPSTPQNIDVRLLDRMPIGVMLYRGDEVLAANKTLLECTGFADAAALAKAGGIDALFDRVPNEDGETALCLRVPEGKQPVDAKLSSIPWQSGTALMLTVVRRPSKPKEAPAPEAPAAKETPAESEALATAQASNRELRSILDTATDGVIVLGSDGKIHSANRSAQALFGYETGEFNQLLELFAPESQRDAADYFEGLTRNGVASLLNDGREVIGRERQGGLIPLFMTMGRIGEERFCAVFRDITQWKRAEEDLTNAKRQAEKASSAKSDFLAAISHEVRTPLNAIIGFAEVMMEEQLGPLGNDRYREYVKDIHTSGQHTISLINDLLDLSKIEAGRLDLTFTKVDINDVTQQCVAIMQPQANRERIIIRTALSPTLPSVVADQRSVRQIALNLLSNSIKYTGAGGQVIVSTALTDQGEVVLRVRDTGVGMSEKDITAALEPFRQLSTTRRDATGSTGLGLPLTKALSEANRAEFRIKSAVNAGTLVEIVFPATRVLSE
ncbi:cell-division control histidine kinase PdhS [Variibacter gotjawalensis]|uniref:histidine kinase n=1 Tax=Variibacter gotjawalensis TaxID=1333996 RepID=A0A0S3PPL4_9BRAD|nr:PAS domain-containing sensor histidine kinase [Variibacter gotjawalensis]NIK48174.1 PAS domain S-box-containing protein [Variibacter gotjawalensis]RZS50046.1 PAS/PAC sensor signal transduction histidine kinase [Variibacter gotjawalensis]BAT57877.1 cell-division control histidine kinase PdhS [Variibacter gotjawalensis]